MLAFALMRFHRIILAVQVYFFVLVAPAFADSLDGFPLLRHYLGTPDNPELVVYRIVPSRVRYMREWALDYHEVALEALGE